MLREQECAIYFILAEKTKTRDVIISEKHHICRLDMPTKTLMQSKLLTHLIFYNLVIFPCDFFEGLLDPLASTLEQDLDGKLTKRPRIG
jgi:hypothetical protein